MEMNIYQAEMGDQPGKIWWLNQQKCVVNQEKIGRIQTMVGLRMEVERSPG